MPQVRFKLLETLSDERRKVFALPMSCEPSHSQWEAFLMELEQMHLFMAMRREGGIIKLELASDLRWDDTYRYGGHKITYIDLPTAVLEKIMARSGELAGATT